MKYLFYRLEVGNTKQGRVTELQDEYKYVLWRPSFWNVVPSGVSMIPFGVWWMMHQLRAFANQDYGLFLIYDGETLIHRSGAFPRYFRFSFMKQHDLQIGDTWTRPRYRGKGLATFAVRQIVELHQRPGRTFWYVVEANNAPSIRVVEKAGFVEAGEGTKEPRLGLDILGSYVFQERYSPNKS